MAHGFCGFHSRKNPQTSSSTSFTQLKMPKKENYENEKLLLDGEAITWERNR